MNQHNVIATVQRELRRYPGVKMEAAEGGRHRRLVFQFGGQSRFLTIPKTQSDWRASKNAIRDFRKTMAELGAASIAASEAQAPRKAAKRGAVANVSLTDKLMVIHIPAASKLINRFRAADGRAGGTWEITLRPSVDLTAPPLIVVRRGKLPPGAARKQGMVAGFAIGNGAWRITMGRGLFPALNSVDRIDPVGVRLYEDRGDEMVFQLPAGTVPTGFTKHDPEPEADEAPAEAAAQPEPQAEPQIGLKDQPMILQFPRQSVSVEAAINVLNKAKRRLGDNLRFSIVEGGLLAATHRIGH